MAKNVSIAEILASRSIPTGEGYTQTPQRTAERRTEPEREAAGAADRPAAPESPVRKSSEALQAEKASREAEEARIREAEEREAAGHTKVFDRVRPPETEEEPVAEEAETDLPEAEEGRIVPLQELIAASRKSDAPAVWAAPEEEPEAEAEEAEAEPEVSEPEELPVEEPAAEEAHEPEPAVKLPAFGEMFEEIELDPEETAEEEEPEEIPAFEDVFEEFDLDSVRSERDKKEFMRRIPKMGAADVELISQNLSGKLQDSLDADLRTPTAEAQSALQKAADEEAERLAREEEERERERLIPMRDRKKYAMQREREKKATAAAASRKRDKDEVRKPDVRERRRPRDIEAQDFEDETEKRPRSGLIKEIIIIAAVFLLCLFVIPNFIMQRTIVNGDSMNESLHDGDQLMVDKLTPHFKAYERFDVVVFYPFGKDASDEYYIKRVIGLPGETVQIEGDTIYIDGKVLEEHYGKDPMTYAGIAAEPIKLGEDEFFLLGDHREISFDSRYEQVGVVKRSQIAGKAVIRIWPLSKFGSFND